MIYKTSNDEDVKKALNYIKELSKKDCKFELKKISDSRTSKQNRALHLYFSFISNELNELGMEFNYKGLSLNDLSSRYTSEIVKEFIWRPIQVSLFNVKSTSKINTKQMNEIIDVITKFFANKGVTLDFPNIETLI